MGSSLTARELQHRKLQGQPIVVLTAYDATFAALFDAAGVDAILVGDSLGMVVQGHDSTIPVTLDDMVYHTRCVRRGCQRAHLIGDLPFLTYHESPEQALRSAGRLIQEGGAQSVKLEGGRNVATQVARIVQAGIPVMGHIGLTPQSVHQLGGYRVQGKTPDAAERLLDDALALQDAGCFAIVLECVPALVARRITGALQIPTIGIGAGPHCDGQVLVGYDLLGMSPGARPKFVKAQIELHRVIVEATQRFVSEVRSGVFPDARESYGAVDSPPLMQ